MADLFRKWKSLYASTTNSFGTGEGVTITPASVAGLPTDTEITLTFDRQVEGKIERIRGVVSGGNFVVSSGGRGADGTTEQSHTSPTVEHVPNGSDVNDMVDGILTEHNQDGTHSDINADSVTTADLTLSGTSVSEILDEDDMASDSATALATQQSIKAYVDAEVGSLSDWRDLGHTLSYASADSPTFTATVAGVDLTSVIPVGARIRVSQSTGGTKYFIVTAIAFSTNTTITLYGGTDYTLNNEAISSPVFSTAKAPVGFPLNPAKWSIETTDTSNRSQATPTNGQWYNLGSLNIVIPIGVWQVYYKAKIEATDTSSVVAEVEATLSTANNSESDTDFSSAITFLGPTGNHTYSSTVSIIKHALLLASKTTYYLNASQNNSMNSINFRGDESKTVIRAVSAYL